MSPDSLWKRVPWTLLICTTGLVLLGLSGIARADELSTGTDRFPRQVLWATLAVPLLVVAAAVPYRSFKPSSYLLFAATLPLLIVVFFMPPRNGARSWIPLGFFDLQPSELAKLAFILALAHYLMYRDHYRRLPGLIPPFLVTLVPLALILKEPDLGSAMLFIPVLFAMLFAAGARLRHLTLVVALGIAMLPVFWLGMNAEQKSRITSLFAQTEGGPAPRGDGYHQHQSKLMLALGGAWGSEVAGMAVDDPGAYHLPAGQTDFVFCLVGERWGLGGCLLTLLLYAVLFARGLAIAAATREPFGRLVAVGIVALLASQTVINTGMTVGLMPITGITLPLMSYGGSSLLSTAVALGLLINVGLRPGYEVTPDPFRFAD
ncbi:FtsW/RodA/SpoVE family cell cycle protein [Planctellipticum variicoloris]|uniref:FtsW/RodA/SpoVE family cell cycle protein n=1 Tax=Planctellipticum variicoloris TaxID=3064265 RepID=UPI003013DFB7|nr:FtsW/RodA/SpoVE family cell cycle protein [Planctomycetaceae bacterium SH412]